MAARAAEERARTGSARLVVGSLEERMEVMAVEKALGSLRLAREGRRGVVFGLGFGEEVSESEEEGDWEVSDIEGPCSLSGETSSLLFSRSMSEDEAEEARSMGGKSEGSTSSTEAEEELLL